MTKDTFFPSTDWTVYERGVIVHNLVSEFRTTGDILNTRAGKRQALLIIGIIIALSSQDSRFLERARTDFLRSWPQTVLHRMSIEAIAFQSITENHDTWTAYARLTAIYHLTITLRTIINDSTIQSDEKRTIASIISYIDMLASSDPRAILRNESDIESFFIGTFPNGIHDRNFQIAVRSLHRLLAK
ncbi:MAG: hypothetical protein WC477_03120 [Patescibacteria group bacterium]